jgi:hypothetical protein
LLLSKRLPVDLPLKKQKQLNKDMTDAQKQKDQLGCTS